jgi:hypothetical protein
MSDFRLQPCESWVWSAVQWDGKGRDGMGVGGFVHREIMPRSGKFWKLWVLECLLFAGCELFGFV